MVKVKRKPQQNRLRIGRYSTSGQVYLITCVTAGRRPVFRSMAAARRVIASLIFSDRAGWSKTSAYVLMPDHLHWLFELRQTKSLARLIGTLKGYSSRRLVDAGLCRSPVWQRGYHDHAIRVEEDLRAVSRYIVANPLRAGLCDEIGQYPHWDAIWMDQYVSKL